ncbi:carotenoid 9,10(9',10')-cleavage dioxygenase-like isoform X2 [Tripterygium wilfordii]|uniref:carotenoid 9,10(9',10')-cleavage dioxygenase-like isoform X2 n=1 Tax=Tripterygium wilfordii TaxID=458696 RepID=UPI0018F80C67|nr:carotenoid 9,10(9',10')-cleavage dioxygenase-like isoform X2 [Tripterygium wilfordii]
MASSSVAQLMISCSAQKPSLSTNFDHLIKSSIPSSTSLLFVRELQKVLPLQVEVPKIVKTACITLVDAFVDSVFEFVDQPLLPSQSNFAPVDHELKEAVFITAGNIEGRIPDDFRAGVYVRNVTAGPNPLFGGLKSTISKFGRSSHSWIEGEGILHSLYFNKHSSDGTWTILYNNRYVETETCKQEKQRNKPSFLPAIEGDSPAVVSAYLLNLLRFGKVNKDLSNTNVFEHAGKFYSIAENYVPQMIDIFTLETLGDWTINGSWNRPFTSHPKRAPVSGELVIMGVNATKPFLEVADGNTLVHKVDIKLNRCTLCHDIGVTERYIVILDFPLSLDINRLVSGGPLIKYNKEGYARIGIMPRYGHAESVKWFDVEPNCTFHILNCFEDDAEVVARGCRAHGSLIPGPDFGLNKLEWFSTRLKPIESGGVEDVSVFFRAYEWRLNVKTGEVKERYLTSTEFAMDFPIINGDFTGLKNRYGYTQVVDSIGSCAS